MAARRAAVALTAIGLLCGCGSSGPHYALKTPPPIVRAGPIVTAAPKSKSKPKPGQPHPSQRDAERLRPVLEGWAAALRRGDPDRAARYFAVPAIVAQSMTELKSTDPVKLAEHLRKGAKFDIGKAREGYFRAYDNQMMMDMYAVRAKKAADMKDQWDIYDALGTVPGPNEDLETIAPPKDGVCKIG